MKIGVIIKNFLDFTTTQKRWTVEGCTYCNGRFESFWFYNRALKALPEFEDFYPFVDIYDLASDFRVRIKDNPEGIDPPVVIVGPPRIHKDGWIAPCLDHVPNDLATTCCEYHFSPFIYYPEGGEDHEGD